MKKLSLYNDGLNSFNGISFFLTRKNIRNLIIKVNSKNQIVVSIPLGANDELITSFLQRNIDKFKQHIDNKNISININEGWFYLFGLKNYFILDKQENKIIINNKKYSLNNKDIIDVINNYRKKQLKIYLLVRQLQYQRYMNIEDHLVRVRDKNTAWATNYTQKKIIYYSTNLSSFSRDIIDYVIVHELSHNKFQDHSRNFWDFVQVYEPDYKRKRMNLRKLLY